MDVTHNLAPNKPYSNQLQDVINTTSYPQVPIDSSGNKIMKEICPRGNNKVVIYIPLYHDKCLLFMLELY